MKKVLLAIVIIILALVAGAFIFFTVLLNRIQRVDTSETEESTNVAQTYVDEATVEQDPDYDPNAVDSIEVNSDMWGTGTIVPMEDRKVTNVLLIGQDRREGQGRQRSDSMIICSLNRKTNIITMTSLMRDMYVPIPGYDANRINAAYVFGGMDLLDQVIKEDFGVVIDANIEVDFDGFITAFTEIGNLDIDLTADEAAYINNEVGSSLYEGTNSLNSEELLSYCRMRYVGNSDWERTERQRTVLTKAFQKLMTEDPITIVRTANNVFPTLTTDMSNGQIVSCIYTVLANNMTTTESYRIPVDGTYSSETISGMEVLVPDLAANSAQLQTYIYGESKSY